MQAYEFYATPKNGTIQIPEQYKNKINARIKVILLDEMKKDENETKKRDLLLPPTLDTKGWKFNREEANE